VEEEDEEVTQPTDTPHSSAPHQVVASLATAAVAGMKKTTSKTGKKKKKGKK
jgi:hypothetical protein